MRDTPATARWSAATTRVWSCSSCIRIFGEETLIAPIERPSRSTIGAPKQQPSTTLSSRPGERRHGGIDERSPQPAPFRRPESGGHAVAARGVPLDVP